MIIADRCYTASSNKGYNAKVYHAVVLCYISYKYQIVIPCVRKFLVCNMNVHKRCQKNVANNCGINTRQMAEVLDQIGISPSAGAKVC